jgi:elongation factor P--(R)-beta-lysine ligase
MTTYRQLKDNPNLWDRYFLREKVIKAIRAFFDANGFHEIEAPILIAHPPAESYIDVFETTLLDRSRKPHKAYLSTSPEVPLKKLMVAGLKDCYSITKSFRNTEMQSTLHNPEFTILEWYRVGADYKAVMEDCEELILSIHKSVCQDSFLTYQGKTIDLSLPWDRLTVAESFKKYASVDFDEFLDMDNARNIAAKKGYTVESHFTWEQLYNQIFLNEIETKLGMRKPLILYEFPGSMAALARKKASDPRFAERFEFYIEGLELGDAYSELTDAKEQEERFNNELKELKRLGKTMYEYDHDFIEALKLGLPECSGIAVGVDRLVMLFADVIDIKDTLFFPIDELFPS